MKLALGYLEARKQWVVKLATPEEVTAAGLRSGVYQVAWGFRTHTAQSEGK
jgi:hypothetical protein